MSTPRVPLLFGTATMGKTAGGFVRNTDLSECQSILDAYLKYGHREIDTALNYGGGSTQEYLAKLDLKGSTVDTKIHPRNPGGHTPEGVYNNTRTCIETLKPHNIRVLYLHAPDRSVPFEETLTEIDKLHKVGKFEIFGLSNFAAWEVAEVVGICKARNFVPPKIYQAMYNPITRAIEPELAPCLRKNGIRLVIYNPLAGGFFAGRLSSMSDEAGRFDTKTATGIMYRKRFVKQAYFDALDTIKVVAEKHQLRLTEIALRWCQHHSVLGPGDGVILGATSVQQVEQNCEDSLKGPLPEEVLQVLDEAWLKVGLNCESYWR